MKEYVLSYYQAFRCVAGKCKHTCCAGWKMNIDEQTLSAYKNNQTDFSKRLENGINFKKSQFKADKTGRCAFLNEKGLCEIILNLGEDSLCQVCRDHPRFRSFFDDRIEMGLGFCCEEATRIILSYEEKITPVLVVDNNACNDECAELDFNQKNILEFREKALKIVQDRAVLIDDRLNSLLKLCNASVSAKDFNRILKTFLSLERLDKSWTKRVKKLKRKTFDCKTEERLSLCAEQFLTNSIYRHLYVAEDTIAVRAITIACVCSWWLIKGIMGEELSGGDYSDEQRFAVVVDVVRAFSAEVEYSQKNLDKLFNFAEKFIKI